MEAAVGGGQRGTRTYGKSRSISSYLTAPIVRHGVLPIANED
jgi:hypothetical protein